jgi:hypothetical protein
VAPSDESKTVEHLYALPPEEFTKTRNELVSELKKAGEREEAARVASLKKPTVAAWVVNQLARREKMNVRALLTAGERLRDAHADVLGGASPAVLEKARSAERQAIEALARSAAKLVEEQRGKAPSSLLDDVRDTLHAAAVDPALADEVRSGRLSHETQALGFGFEAAPSGTGAGRPKTTKRPKPRDGRRRAAEKRLAEAKTRLGEARKELKESEEDVKRTQSEHRRAERQAQRRREELERAEAAAAQAEERLHRLDAD